MLQKLEESLLTPAIRSSKEDLNNLLSDDFIEITSSGKMYDKKQIINALLEEENISFKLQDFKAKSLSKTLTLVTYTAIKNNRFVSLRSSIWSNHDGKWQMIFHQGTMVHS